MEATSTWCLKTLMRQVIEERIASACDAWVQTRLGACMRMNCLIRLQGAAAYRPRSRSGPMTCLIRVQVAAAYNAVKKRLDVDTRTVCAVQAQRAAILHRPIGIEVN